MSTPTDNAAKPETVPRRFGQVVGDMYVLADLQWQLFKSDSAECAMHFIAPAGAIAIAFVLLLAALPIAMTAIALLLIAAGMPAAGAFALVAVLALSVVGGLAVWAWARLRSVSSAFRRSREELAKNIAWFKEVVDRSGRVAREPHEAAGCN
jgi:hypothetical protein